MEAIAEQEQIPPAQVATPAKEPRPPRRMGYHSAKSFIVNFLEAIESGYEVRIGDYDLITDKTYVEMWDMTPGAMVMVIKFSGDDLDTLMAHALGQALERRGIIAQEQLIAKG